MALSKSKKLKFAAIMLWNRTVSKIIKVDIYGVRLFGVQFTPKTTADVLKVNGDFSSNQRDNYDIRLLFKSVYIFIPRLA